MQRRTTLWLSLLCALSTACGTVSAISSGVSQKNSGYAKSYQSLISSELNGPDGAEFSADKANVDKEGIFFDLVQRDICIEDQKWKDTYSAKKDPYRKYLDIAPVRAVGWRIDDLDNVGDAGLLLPLYLGILIPEPGDGTEQAYFNTARDVVTGALVLGGFAFASRVNSNATPASFAEQRNTILAATGSTLLVDLVAIYWASKQSRRYKSVDRQKRSNCSAWRPGSPSELTAKLENIYSTSPTRSDVAAAFNAIPFWMLNKKKPSSSDKQLFGKKWTAFFKTLSVQTETLKAEKALIEGVIAYSKNGYLRKNKALLMSRGNREAVETFRKVVEWAERLEGQGIDIEAEMTPKVTAYKYRLKKAREAEKKIQQHMSKIKLPLPSDFNVDRVKRDAAALILEFENICTGTLYDSPSGKRFLPLKNPPTTEIGGTLKPTENRYFIPGEELGKRWWATGRPLELPSQIDVSLGFSDNRSSSSTDSADTAPGSNQGKKALFSLQSSELQEHQKLWLCESFPDGKGTNDASPIGQWVTQRGVKEADKVFDFLSPACETNTNQIRAAVCTESSRRLEHDVDTDAEHAAIFVKHCNNKEEWKTYATTAFDLLIGEAQWDKAARFNRDWARLLSQAWAQQSERSLVRSRLDHLLATFKKTRKANVDPSKLKEAWDLTLKKREILDAKYLQGTQSEIRRGIDYSIKQFIAAERFYEARNLVNVYSDSFGDSWTTGFENRIEKAERRYQRKQAALQKKQSQQTCQRLRSKCQKWRTRWKTYGSCQRYCSAANRGNRGGFDLGYKLCEESCFDKCWSPMYKNRCGVD